MSITNTVEDNGFNLGSILTGIKTVVGQVGDIYKEVKTIGKEDTTVQAVQAVQPVYTSNITWKDFFAKPNTTLIVLGSAILGLAVIAKIFRK